MAEETSITAPVPEPTAAAPESQAPPSPAGQESLLSANTNLLDWRSTFPDNLRNDAVVQRYQTPEAAAKALTEQARMLSRSLGFLPDAEPGSDEYRAGIGKIKDKLGRPDTADKYEFAAPEGRALDTEIQGRLAKDFYVAGLTQHEVSDVMASYWRTVEYAERITAAREQESYQEGRNQLFGEFGANTEKELDLAQQFVNHFGAGAFSGEAGQKFWEQIREAKLADGSRLINSPYMVATFGNAMRKLGEGQFHRSAYFTPGQDTMATMTKRADELQAKRFSPGGLTENETAELFAIRDEQAAARNRQAQGRAA